MGFIQYSWRLQTSVYTKVGAHGFGNVINIQLESLLRGDEGEQLKFEVGSFFAYNQVICIAFKCGTLYRCAVASHVSSFWVVLSEVRWTKLKKCRFVRCASAAFPFAIIHFEISAFGFLLKCFFFQA